MNPIRCIAVDDEPLALALLADNIGKVPFLTLVGTADDAYEAISLLEREPVELLFLDIQMPGLTGTQLLRGLTQRPAVILVTAYEQYALDGFELDVLDYLLKPVDFSRFLRAAQKARQQIRPNAARLDNAVAPVAPEFFFVNADYALVRIQTNTVLYVEGLKDYVKIHTTQHPRPVISRMTLRAMEEHLPGSRFARVHRSFIVDTDRIELLRGGKITLNGTTIPVGEQYAPALLELLRLTGRA